MTARELAEHFGNIDAIIAADGEKLSEVKDVGEVIAKSVTEFFKNPAHIEEVEKLKAAGLNFSLDEEDVKTSSALEGRTFVVTGTFSVSRDEIKALIGKNSGKCSSAVSSKTDYLLAGEKGGPDKLKKAQDLNVKVISEQDFYKMLPGAVVALKKEEVAEELSLF